jgi:hypothetical protein
MSDGKFYFEFTAHPIFPIPKPRRNPPMKINMLLHFYGCAEAFAPEKCRTSPAYTQFVKELLRDGLIERPTREEREEYPGFAYRTTEKGDAFVHAICTVPTPVAKTRWVIPR